MTDPEHPWFDVREASLSFGLEFEESNFEEDQRAFVKHELDEGPAADWVRRIRKDSLALLELEDAALREMSQLLDRPIQTQGHDRYGALICVVSLRSWSDFLSLWNRRLDVLTEDGGNNSLSETPYMCLDGLRLQVAEDLEFVPAKDSGYFELPSIEDLIQSSAPEPTIRGPRRVTRQTLLRRLKDLS